MTGGGSRIVAPMPPALDTLLEPVYRRALFAFTLDVMDPITVEAILN